MLLTRLRRYSASVSVSRETRSEDTGPCGMAWCWPLDDLPQLGSDVLDLLFHTVDYAVEAFGDLALGLTAQAWGDDEPGRHAGDGAGEEGDRELGKAELVFVEHGNTSRRIRMRRLGRRR